MKKNYSIEGMSCEGCVDQVKKAIQQLPAVDAAEIKLHPPIASLNLNKSIELSELQAALSKAGKYTIKELIPA